MKRVRAFLSAFVLVAVLAACGGGGGDGDGDTQVGDGAGGGDAATGDVQIPDGGGGFDAIACTKAEDCVGQVPGLGACQAAGCVDGACVAVAGPNGTACDDGNVCTENDVCTGGACAGTPVTDGDCHPCGASADCLPFEDGDACNGTLTCVAGKCELDATTVVECPAADDCAEYVCNTGTGECDPSPINEGLGCEDPAIVCAFDLVCEGGDCVCPDCEQDCTGLECGDDPVCGESCGDCDAGESCVEGLCVPDCVPVCGDRVCGPDPQGCGTSCGDCDAALACNPDGECVAPDPCQFVSDTGCCEDGILVYCNAGVLDAINCGAQANPDFDACGWSAEFGYYDCVAEPTTDPSGAAERDCPILECETDCAAEGRVCGQLPGCPFLDCGACDEGEECTDDGQCETFVDECLGVSEPGCCDDGLLLYCEGGALQFIQCADPATCGWNADAGFYDCGTAGEPAPGNDPPIECPAIDCGTCAEQGVACGMNPRCPWLECEIGCTDGEACVAGECVPDRCLGVPEIGCCDDGVIYGCSGNMLFSSDCTETEGNICGWYTGDASFPPGYYCGPTDLLVAEDPSGENPAACTFAACDNATFCAEAGYECGLGCPGESCGDCGADAICGPDRLCHPVACAAANEGAAVECGATPATISDDTATVTNAVQDYPSCVDYPYDGPEKWHEFTPSCDGPVTVVLTGPTDGNDLDVLVLEAECSGNAAVCTFVGAALGDENFQFEAVAGTTYYLVVEGYQGAAGAYTLDVTCACTCEQQCDGRVCGPDPVCGESCGECDLGQLCGEDGQCGTDPCLGISGTGCCMDGVNYYCGENGLLASEDCGEAGCGWLDVFFFAYYACGGEGEDPSGQFPLDCEFGACDDATFCDELGYECGLGCPGGASCGECAAGEYCTADRQCEVCSCEALGLECGTHPVPECALECGTCDDGFFCTAEQICEAVPFCGDNTTVGTIDCGAGPVTVSGDTTDSVNELDSYPGCGGGGETGPEEVHTFVPSCSGTVVVDLIGPDDDVNDMDLYVLRGECRADGDFCEGGSQDFGSIESVTFEAEQDVTYYLVVEGYAESMGAYDLTVTCACTCEPDCASVECGPDPNCGTDCGGCETPGDVCIDTDNDNHYECVAGSTRTCETPMAIACEDTVTGDNTLAQNALEGPYPCSGYSETAGEEVYQLTLEADTTVTLDLTGIGSNDLDLYVLETSCDAAACIAYSATVQDEHIEFEALAAATYYVVVDGFGGDVSTYTLSVGCAAPCVPDCTDLECGPDPVCGQECGPCGEGQLCEDGACTTPAGLTCATPGALACDGSVQGDTATSPNLMEEYACSFFSELGGEDVYLLTLTPDTAPTLSLSGMTNDLDLLVLEVPEGSSCGAAACVAAATTGGDETLDFVPVAGATYYAVVETFLAAEPDAYTLALSCPAACVPDCTGLECGPDPVCGEECGPCTGGAACVEGACVSACANPTGTLTCGGAAIAADNTTGTSRIEGYSCAPLPETRPEHIYAFEVPADGSYTFSLWSELPADHDIFILGDDCDPANCIDWDDREVTLDALAGETYYIVVDGYDEGPAGTYHLAVACDAVVHVAIVDSAFVEADISIATGTTVRWINLGPSPHTTTSTDEPQVWDSQTLQVGESFQYTFGAVGTFPYQCTLHPNLTGTVTVQ